MFVFWILMTRLIVDPVQFFDHLQYYIITVESQQSCTQFSACDVLWISAWYGYTIIELWHLLYNNGKYFNWQQPQYCLFLKFTNRFTWLTLRMQVADHCIIYLFGESAQKDYRISVVHIPTVHMHVQWTYNTYVQIIKYISSL
jgi:hypothetical protein